MVNNLGIIQLAILASCLMADDRPVSLDDRFTVDGCYRAAREKSQREREAKLKAAQRVQTAEERKQTQDRQAAVARVRAQYDIPDIPGAIECNDFDAMMWAWGSVGMGVCGHGGQTEFQVNLKLGLTSRQEARERRIVGSLKPFRWNPAGNQSRPVEPDQQPEASLAWWVGDHPCEA